MLLRSLHPRHVPAVPGSARPRVLPLRQWGFAGRTCNGTNIRLQCSGRRHSLFGPEMEGVDVDKLRSEFMQVLRSRRSGEVPLSVELAKPVTDPLYQGGSASTEAMESCPKEDIEDFKDRLVEENLYLMTERGEQGRLPVLILSMKDSGIQKRPAVVFLHSSYKAKEWLRPLLEAYASRGYVAIAIDSRYHGERASSKTTYLDGVQYLCPMKVSLAKKPTLEKNQVAVILPEENLQQVALVSSWRNADTMPFIFDTVWDLIKLADYLTRREDIDPSRIGITGESLGGMHAWFAAFADTRYAVVAPIIGVQGFRWAIDNEKWQARVDSIKPVFEEARINLGKSVVDKDVVEMAWARIAPGLAAEFDSPYTVPAIAPRPLVIINGEQDPRCPLPGLNIPITRAEKVYNDANCPEKYKVVAQPGIGHQLTPKMVKEASDWFDRFLK